MIATKGVRLFPVPRSKAPAKLYSARKGMPKNTTLKYSEAPASSASGVCSKDSSPRCRHSPMPARAKEPASKNRPKVAATAVAFFRSPAPQAWETRMVQPVTRPVHT